MASEANPTHNSFNRIATDLVGKRISHLWRGYGSAIFLEFGALTAGRTRRNGSLGNPIGECTVHIEWSWRIETQRSILCGSWSDDAVLNSSLDLLKNAEVSSLTLFGRLPEIDLALVDGLHLLSFATTEGQPQWSLTDRRLSPEVWITVRNGALFESDGNVSRDD